MPSSAISGISMGGGTPVGTVISWPTSAAPDDYYECAGQSLLASDYPELFAVIGYNYGGSAGSFNLPDYRGYFLRGWDHTAGVDPNSTGTDPLTGGRGDRGDGITGDNVGTVQEDGFEKHTHVYDSMGRPGTLAMAGASGGNVDGVTSSTGGDETRPKNIYVMYCIKYQ